MSSANVYDLARETFPRIKAEWRLRLDALGSAYSDQELIDAFARAREYGAGDLSYVETTLRNQAEQRRIEREKPNAQEQDAYEADAARYASIGHVHVLTDNTAYQGEAPEVSEDEIRPYANEQLRWWLQQPACQRNPKNVTLVERILAERANG